MCWLLGSDQVVCGLLLLVRRPKVQQLLWFCKQECSCSGSVAHTLLFSYYVAVWFQNVAKSSCHFWQDVGRQRMTFEWHPFCGVSTKATNNLYSLWKFDYFFGLLLQGLQTCKGIQTLLFCKDIDRMYPLPYSTHCSLRPEIYTL